MSKRIFVSVLAVTALLQADTLVLRNGSNIEGNYAGGDSRSVRFAVGNQINTYNLNDVDSVRFTDAPASQASVPPPPPPPPPAQSRPPESYPPPQPSAPPINEAVRVQVPAGTQIVVRLIDPVNSERDRLGQTYRASVDQPVIVDGQTVIPRGSDAVAALIDAKESGKIQGRTVLTLDLRSITVESRSSDIVTTGVSQASGSRGARSAKVIGATAALGAIIGAAAGGGRGAAIGAGSGAAVGTAAEVVTSGQKVKIPAETRLTFTLQNPIDL
jgi:hypothetical protein